MPSASNGPVEIYYESFGDPGDPALLLVNGLGSQCISYRAEWCRKFAAEGFVVIRFDNRDTGLSTKFRHVQPDVAAVATAIAEQRPAPAPYTLSDMASDAVAVLDALAIERAHAMGVSMGGMIVQTMAIEHPERLLSMTSVMSTTGDLDVGLPSADALSHLMSPPAADRAEYIERYLRGIRVWGSPGCYDESRLRAFAADAFDRCYEPDGQARQMMAVMASGSRSGALAEITVPTLVIHGSADRLVDPSGGRRTAEVVPGARFELVEGMGHDYPPQYWDRLVELVTAHARSAVRP
jgi:pimeloyl-ACP methyl ester carboxylesterase